MPGSASEAVNILLVEDDEIDVEIIKRRFHKENITNPLWHATSGVEALKLLRGQNNDKVTRPYMMLVDINMPMMNGMELLKALREDDELKQSIVFILTTSDRDKDRSDAYNLNAAGYFLKDDLDELIQMLNHYWQINKFPINGNKSGFSSRE
jgi:CheY-like chemotaxis protein